MKAVVVGASRGLGRGIVEAMDGAVGISRTSGSDARERQVAVDALRHHQPDVLVIVAGAVPDLRPLHEHTWESFSLNFDADVKIAFEWTRAALVTPLSPLTRIIVISSGAALRGSTLSAGYAGAKASQRFIAAAAQSESDRLGLGLGFTTVFPTITPHGEVGRESLNIHAEQAGKTVGEYLGGAVLTPEIAGREILKLASTGESAAEYMLTGDGLRPL